MFTLGRIIQKSSRRPNSLYGSAQLIRQYRYDAAHRLIQSQRIDLAGQPEEQRQLNQYRYDSVGQLISSLTDHQHHHYPTDPTGNQLDNTGQWVKANQVTKLGLYSYQYDDYGRLSQRLNHLTGEIQSHHYDAENRLVRIDYKNSRQYSRVHYDYDALNRRISKTVYGIEQASRPIITYYHWQGMQLIGEHLGSQSTAPIYYFYEAGSYTPIARLHCTNSVHQDIVAHNKSTEEELNNEFNLDLKTFQTKVLGLPETPETPHARDKLYYYHAEQNGLPVMLTDEAGQTVWQQTEVTPWGEIKAENQATSFGYHRQNLRFAGQYYDEESGLHYNTLRYYDPTSGRFTQPDPIGLAGGINLYQYAPNPLTWLDPLGLSCATDTDLFASGNKTKPRDPRIEGYNLKPGQKADLYIDADGFVVPNQGGASTFKTAEQLPLTGNYHKLPEGTILPEGIAIKYDGSDMGGKMSPGHATIYPTEAMKPEKFIELFNSLPWEYVGKK